MNGSWKTLLLFRIPLVCGTSLHYFSSGLLKIQSYREQHKPGNKKKKLGSFRKFSRKMCNPFNLFLVIHAHAQSSTTAPPRGQARLTSSHRLWRSIHISEPVSLRYWCVTVMGPDASDVLKSGELDLLLTLLWANTTLRT